MGAISNAIKSLLFFAHLKLLKIEFSLGLKIPIAYSNQKLDFLVKDLYQCQLEVLIAKVTRRRSELGSLA